MSESTRLGEVIEAGTTQFAAQCYELYRIPPLGSLVKTRDGEVELYGVVCGAATASLEQGRRPIARGKDETSEESVYTSSPQLLKLLRSEFSVLVVGHKEGQTVRQYLAPQPARIHAFVYACTPEEIREFSSSFGFLDLLVKCSVPVPVDELVAAALRQMSAAHDDRRSFMVAAGKELAVLLSGQYDQLRSILWRLK